MALNLEELPTGLQAEIPIASLKISFAVKDAENAYLMNMASDSIVVKKGFLAGLGKITWHHMTGDKHVTDDMLLYSLSSSSEVVFYNNELATLGEVLNTKRQTHPTAAVNYHVIEPTMKWAGAQAAGAFTLKLKNRIAGQVVTGQDTKNRETIGAALPLKTWLSNAVPSVKVIWQMKWAGLMLMPQRLILAVMEDVTISGKKAWKIAGKEL